MAAANTLYCVVHSAIGSQRRAGALNIQGLYCRCAQIDHCLLFQRPLMALLLAMIVAEDDDDDGDSGVSKYCV